MTLRDVVLIVVMLNFLLAYLGFAWTGFTFLSAYLLLINFCTVLLAYWIRDDGEEIRYLEINLTELTKSFDIVRVKVNTLTEKEKS